MAFQMNESETRWFLLEPEGKKKSDSNHQMAALWFRKELTGRACKESGKAWFWQSWDSSLDRDDSFEIEVKISYLHGNSSQI